MITAYATGTQTCTVTTEHFISSPNVAGLFRLVLDLDALAANDVLEVRAYKMTLTGGTSRQIGFWAFYGADGGLADGSVTVILPDTAIPNELTDANAVRFSLKQTFGTGRDIPWAVLRDDALVPTTAGRPLDVTATGAAGIDLANVEGQSAALALSGTTIKAVTDVDTKLGTPAGASVSADIAAIEAQTDDIGAAGAGLTAIPAMVLDEANAIETGWTLRRVLRIIAAALGGKVSGAAANAPVFRSITDAKDRITATTDADGNRTAVTLDGT